MILLILFIVISFLLDGLLSVIIPFDTLYLFKTFFSLVSIVVLFPYLEYNNKLYFLIVFVLGLFFDIVYTNTIMLNAILFLFFSYVTRYLYTLLRNNLLNGIVISSIIIFFYNLLTYTILVVIGISTYPFIMFLYQFIFIDIINILYFIVAYQLIKLIYNDKKSKYRS